MVKAKKPVSRKTNNKNSKLNKFLKWAKNPKHATLMVFIVGFAVFGIYTLRTSDAAGCYKYTYRSSSKGTCQRYIQTLANHKGARLKVDGAYGSATANAIKKIQKNFGLKQDGVVGRNTWAVLCSNKVTKTTSKGFSSTTASAARGASCPSGSTSATTKTTYRNQAGNEWGGNEIMQKDRSWTYAKIGGKGKHYKEREYRLCGEFKATKAASSNKVTLSLYINNKKFAGSSKTLTPTTYFKLYCTGWSSKNLAKDGAQLKGNISKTNFRKLHAKKIYIQEKYTR
jgi:peptidoglycan hydrolase-like protein with peptidoglycan-binding domain